MAETPEEKAAREARAKKNREEAQRRRQERAEAQRLRNEAAAQVRAATDARAADAEKKNKDKDR